ncbi:MAG: hypothetical protein ACO1NX_11150 [Chitinophagaceae bacterium]
MRKLFFFFLLAVGFQTVQAQKLEGIYFNLYTDSLKKGFYNYINVDGKYADGSWLPLDSSQIQFSANTGFFKGNDLFIDSSYTADSVVVKAVLKKDPAVWKQVVIYIRKRGFDEPLKTDEEIFNDMQKDRRRVKQRTALL